MATENEIIKIAEQFINHTNRHLFLTGRAGTGKTTFLKKIYASTHKNTVIAAPTGIAAINAGGVTLHSLFQLPFGSFIPENSPLQVRSFKVNTPHSLMKELQMNRTKREMIRAMELLIIDEVSMLRADLLDAIDVVLRTVRRKQSSSFGGVQILFIGDLLQLPPVVKDEEMEVLNLYYKSLHFFNARSLRGKTPLYIELQKIYRQSDPTFIEVLNRLRENRINKEDIQLLNAYYDPSIEKLKDFIDDGYIQITTHNRIADDLNSKTLKRLKGKSYYFEASVKGDFPEHQFPVDPMLEIKEGAQVMFIKNDYSGESLYFNGKIGTVSEIDDDDIWVGFEDGTNAKVGMYEWENKRYQLNNTNGEIEEKVIGSFSHYPIKLAWAITVHKSQGLTFDKAIIDVSRAFAPGQIYVALSRLTSLKGLRLNARIPENRFMVDEAINDFSNQKKEPNQLEQILKDETIHFLYDNAVDAFNFNYMLGMVYHHCDSYNKEEGRSKKQAYKSWALQLKKDLVPQKDVAEAFQKKISNYKKNNFANLSQIKERVEAAGNYFSPILKDFSNRCFKMISLLQGEVGVKQYINELHDLEMVFFKQLQHIDKAALLINAVSNEKILSKASLTEPAEVKERTELLKTHKGGKRRKKALNEKVPKIKTHHITFELLQKGNGLDDVATIRNLTEATIFNHIIKLVEEKKINPFDYIDKRKVDKIHKVVGTIDSTLASEIKAKLGDEYSYEEIRLSVKLLSIG